jgi:hypothetical protein
MVRKPLRYLLITKDITTCFYLNYFVLTDGGRGGSVAGGWRGRGVWQSCRPV